MNRKTFLKRNLMAGGLALTTPSLLIANDSVSQEELFDGELIREFVFAAHKSLDETRKLLEKNPLLLNCANQSRKGDFETAMGGASHMGRRDIADFLVGKGARLDIFSQTFLGFDDFVKELISQHPSLLNSYGPHGFTLLHHAEVGERTALADWLQSKGLTEKHFKGVFGSR